MTIYETPTVANAPRTPETAPLLFDSKRLSMLDRITAFTRTYPIPIAAIVLMIAAGILWVPQHSVARLLLLVVILLGGIPLLIETVRNMLHREFGVDLIAIIAIFGSLLQGEYLAGAIVVLMLSGGEALEAFALSRAKSSLAGLAERAPRIAHVWHEDTLVDVDAQTIIEGMVVVVKPGEMLPVDGVITKGTTIVSEADLTGEPVPVTKATGMLVLSGSVNLDVVIEVQATKSNAESQYAQIIKLVQEAQEQKAPLHRLADRYSVWFTLAAISLAGLAWIISGQSIYALAVMVVATPCPLILATPIAIMSGIGSAAKAGLIAKSGGAIEQLGEVDVAVFDKTGTLTLGHPAVADLVLAPTCRWPRTQVVCAVTSVEQLSSHILAQAIVAYGQQAGTATLPVIDFRETLGKGVAGTIVDRDGTHVRVAVGNRTFMEHLAITIPFPMQEERNRRVDEGDIASYIAFDNEVIGMLVMNDIPRDDIAAVIRRLRATGIREVLLLTGDNASVARRIGDLAGVDRVVAHCLPEDKVRVVRELLASNKRVLMVGDGVNDAPALASASVGIAIGAQGLTAAAAAADAVLLSGDIDKIVTAVSIGRWVMFIARQGIWIGMGLSGIAMIVAACGFLPPAAGAILQEGIDVIVILNALRAGRVPVTPRTQTP